MTREGPWGPVGPWCWKGLSLDMILPVCHAMPGAAAVGTGGQGAEQSPGKPFHGVLGVAGSCTVPAT